MGTKRCLQVLTLTLLSSISAANAEDLEALCAEVQISISQEASLERQAFEASMVIKNSLDTLSLDNVKVELLYEDADRNAVEVTNDPAPGSALFFERLDDTVGIDAVDGSGTIDPATSAEIRWLIIPTAGAAGQESNGKLYFVGANLSYTFGGEPQTISVAPDTIVVRPQPLLTLDYFLTREIIADDGFTTEIESPVPYTLGIRIKNNGYGSADDIRLESAQPTIVENEQGLSIGFKILGAFVNDQPATRSLAVSFGDIESGQSSIARFIMESTLSGEFTEFSALVTHADTLGGELTSLIQAANTSLLVRDVLVDINGRDRVNDFLAINDDGFRVYESEPASTPLAGCQDCAIVLPVQGVMDNSGDTTGVITRIVSAPSTPGFVYIKWEDPFAGEKHITRVVSSNGKILPVENFWSSQTRAADNITFDHFLNIFDNNSTPGYTLTFDEFSDVPVAPAISFMPDRTTFEGSQVGFLMQATDANGTLPTLSAPNLPSGAVFIPAEASNNIAKGSFNWSPAAGQAGIYKVAFVATDGALSSTQSVTITVHPADDVDGDGLNDEWEIENFGNLNEDGGSDFDGDGYTNLEEFTAETDPTTMTTGLLPPEPLSPYYREVLNLTAPTLRVANSVHGEAADIRYLFEIYDDAALTHLVTSGSAEEGASSTEFVMAAPLVEEDGEYYWRVRSYLLPEGLDYSEWRYGRFTVSTNDSAPFAPVISYPTTGHSVDSVAPILVVNNTTDPEGGSVSYAFAVYAASAWNGSGLDGSPPIAFVTGLSAGSQGETAWQVASELLDGNQYYWQASVVDEAGNTSHSAVGQFIVDTSNRLPSIPAISSPLTSSEVVVLDAGQSLSLSVFNSSDADNESLNYEFEIDRLNSFDGATHITSGTLSEGITTTSWSVMGLEENTLYYWRVRSVDGLGTSPWQVASFTVNQTDDAPGQPRVLNPGNLASVATVRPMLAATAGADPDSESLTYLFTLYAGSYADSSLAEPFASNSSPVPFWPLDFVLQNHRPYYWTVQIQDDDGLAGPLSPVHNFIVRDDTEDHAPSINFVSPATNTVLTAGQILVQWQDRDPDSNAAISLYQSLDDGAQTLIDTFTEDLDADNDIYWWDTTDLVPGNYTLVLSIADEQSVSQVENCCTVTLLPTEPGVSTELVGGSIFGAILDETGESLVQVDVVLDRSLATGTQLSINISLSDTTEAEIIGGLGYLQFSDSNWNIPQRITVKGLDDCEIDGDQVVTLILASTVSDDADYHGLDPDDVTLTNTDNEAAGQLLFICDYKLVSQTPVAGGLVDYEVIPRLSNIGQSLDGASATLAVLGDTISLESAAGITFPAVILGIAVDANESITLRLNPETGFDSAKLVWDITAGAISDESSGDSADNTITGTDGNDIIDGKAGNDTLYGLSGDDILIGGTGSDTLYGGEDNDTFIVTGTDAYSDDFYGGGGHDKILGGDGNDTIRLNNFTGTRTVEVIDGNTGINVIEGTNVDDVMDFSNTTLINIKHIDGLAGNDVITGSQAGDVIIGNTGNDYLSGEGGDDVFPVSGTTSGADRFSGGDGFDMVLGTAADDVIGISDHFGIDTVEIIDAGAGNNRIRGTDARNILDFSATQLIGISKIEGLAGNDTIVGTTSSDVIDGGPGDDVLIGGKGNDIFKITGSEGVDTVSGGDGNDRLQGSMLDDIFAFSDFSGSNTVETIDGDGGFNIITGTAADNILNFSATILISINVIEGLAGNDTITGTDQDDHIIGGPGSDDIYGGPGNDLFSMRDADTGFDQFNGGEGTDTILGTTTDDVIRLRTFTGSNTVEVIDGNGGNDTITGTDAGDTLDFSETTLINISLIDSGPGDDTVTGSPGDDVIRGNLGTDTLTGSTGSDSYLFPRGDETAIIADAGLLTDIDRLILSGGVTAEDVWIVSEDNDLVIYLLPGSDSIRIRNWLTIPENRIEEIHTDDTHVLYASQIQLLVDVMTPIGTPVNGSIALTTEQQNAVDEKIRKSWGITTAEDKSKKSKKDKSEKSKKSEKSGKSKKSDKSDKSDKSKKSKKSNKSKKNKKSGKTKKE